MIANGLHHVAMDIYNCITFYCDSIGLRMCVVSKYLYVRTQCWPKETSFNGSLSLPAKQCLYIRHYGAAVGY